MCLIKMDQYVSYKPAEVPENPSYQKTFTFKTPFDKYNTVEFKSEWKSIGKSCWGCPAPKNFKFHLK